MHTFNKSRQSNKVNDQVNYFLNDNDMSNSHIISLILLYFFPIFLSNSRILLLLNFLI